MSDLSIDLLSLVGNDTALKKIANVHGRGPEYEGKCPFCGGKDRFRVQPEQSQWWCRQCSPNQHWQSAADYVMRRDNVNFKEAMKRLGKGLPEPDTWDYHSREGEVVYQIVRFKRNGKKSYAQRTPTASGDWRWGLNGTQPTIYRLPEVLKAAQSGETIYICEGEKCADAIRRLGLVATTNSGGAGRWRIEFSQFLRGAGDCVILADNDEPGQKHAELVLQSVIEIIPTARIVIFSEMPAGGDVADWLILGHTKDDLLQRCTAHPKVDIPSRVEYLPAAYPNNGVTAAQLYHTEFAPLYWTVEGILPEGAALLAGKPKSRKSWAGLDISVACATGQSVFGKLQTRHGRVLYLDLESNQRRMRGRLFSMIGHAMSNLDNLHIYTEWPRAEEGIVMLEGWMSAHPDTVLVVIDVLSDFRRPRDPKEDIYAYDRETVRPLNAFAEKHRITVLLIHHTRKAKSDDVFDEISGSTGLPSAVATMWVLGRAPEGDTILALRGRDLIYDEPLALEWDDDDNRFKIIGSGADAFLGAERRMVLKCMSDDQEWTPKTIAQELKKPVTNIQQLLKVLLSEGLIDRRGRGKYVRVLGHDQNDQKDQNHKNVQNTQNDSDPILILSKQDQNQDQNHFCDYKALDEPFFGDSDRSDLSIGGGEDQNDQNDQNQKVSIVTIQLEGKIAWALWDDRTSQILATFDTEAEALAAKGQGHD